MEISKARRATMAPKLSTLARLDLACGQVATRLTPSLAGSSRMTTDPWDLRDPGQTLRDIAAICPFELDHVIVAAVEIETQTVTDARLAHVGELDGEGHEGSDLVRGLAEELVPERWSVSREVSGMTHLLVTVVCREGRVISTRRETDWYYAWRYSNHGRGAYDGRVYIVTPHGWSGSLDQRAGYEPSLVNPRTSAA